MPRPAVVELIRPYFVYGDGSPTSNAAMEGDDADGDRNGARLTPAWIEAELAAQPAWSRVNTDKTFGDLAFVDPALEREYLRFAYRDVGLSVISGVFAVAALAFTMVDWGRESKPRWTSIYELILEFANITLTCVDVYAHVAHRGRETQAVAWRRYIVRHAQVLVMILQTSIHVRSTNVCPAYRPPEQVSLVCQGQIISLGALTPAAVLAGARLKWLQGTIMACLYVFLLNMGTFTESADTREWRAAQPYSFPRRTARSRAAADVHFHGLDRCLRCRPSPSHDAPPVSHARRAGTTRARGRRDPRTSRRLGVDDVAKLRARTHRATAEAGRLGRVANRVPHFSTSRCRQRVHQRGLGRDVGR